MKRSILIVCLVAVMCLGGATCLYSEESESGWKVTVEIQYNAATKQKAAEIVESVSRLYGDADSLTIKVQKDEYLTSKKDDTVWMIPTWPRGRDDNR